MNYLQMGSYSPTPVDGISIMDVRVLVDHSVLEVFVNGGTSVLTTRVYPTRNDSIGIRFFSLEGTTIFESIKIWTLNSSLY